MASETSPLPVILCGRTEQIARGVIATLQPDIEGMFELHNRSGAPYLIATVVHLILTPEAGKVQIPALLKGEKEVPSDSELGSKNYEKAPVAVLLGAGYDDKAIEELRKASEGTNVPWLRPDTTKPAPPLGPEYGKALVARIKETIKTLTEEKKMEEDAVVWY